MRFSLFERGYIVPTQPFTLKVGKSSDIDIPRIPRRQIFYLHLPEATDGPLSVEFGALADTVPIQLPDQFRLYVAGSLPNANPSRFEQLNIQNAQASIQAENLEGAYTIAILLDGFVIDDNVDTLRLTFDYEGSSQIDCSYTIVVE